MRWSRCLLSLALATLVVACGAPAATTDDADGTGNGDGSEETEPAATSGDGGGSRTGSVDLDRAFEILTPPNSTELSKTEAEGVIFAAFESDDSLESLRSFYEDAIDEAGLQIFSTTEAQGGIAWAVAESEGSSFGGAISIFPASDGSGNQISVTIGEGA